MACYVNSKLNNYNKLIYYSGQGGIWSQVDSSDSRVIVVYQQIKYIVKLDVKG